MHKTIPSYSKAPRGLFVLVEVGRVLTAIANSPGESSRQLLARYAFHARRNFIYSNITIGTDYIFSLDKRYFLSYLLEPPIFILIAKLIILIKPSLVLCCSFCIKSQI